MRYNKGWKNESARHSLAARGLKSGHHSLLTAKGSVYDDIVNKALVSKDAREEREYRKINDKWRMEVNKYYFIQKLLVVTPDNKKYIRYIVVRRNSAAASIARSPLPGVRIHASPFQRGDHAWIGFRRGVIISARSMPYTRELNDSASYFLPGTKVVGK